MVGEPFWFSGAGQGQRNAGRSLRAGRQLVSGGGRAHDWFGLRREGDGNQLLVEPALGGGSVT